MENPLSMFFLIDERAEGVFFKADATKPIPTLDALENALDNSNVVNYTREQLAAILQSDLPKEFAFLGTPLQHYNQEIEKFISVNITARKAEMMVNTAVKTAGFSQLKFKEVAFALKKKGIRFGINEIALQQFVAEPIYDKYVQIAEAQMPVKGENAKIVMEVSAKPATQPRLKEDGSVDYRDIQSFTPVAFDQILARKVPQTAGIAGTAINGELIPSEPGKDIPFPKGKNTKLSDDGMLLLASHPGIVISENNVIQVIEILKIKGDVDFSVGNVKYSGDIQINGNVLPGFSVESEGNIHIKGEVESARIVSRSGDVVISKGVLGKGDTVIIAKKGIHVTFAQEATLKTDGIITVGKYLFNCICDCNSLVAEGNNASLVGGTIRAEHHMLARQIGNEQEIKTSVAIYDKTKLQCEEKIKQLKELETKLLKELEPIEKQLRSKTAIFKMAGTEPSQRLRDELKKWLDIYNNFSMKIKYVRQKMDELRKTMVDPKNLDGYIKVSGNVYPGTEIVLYDSVIPVNGILSAKRFVLNNNVSNVEEPQ